MGTFKATVEIGDPDGAEFEPVEALVDTGSTFTMLPASFLRGLGVTPMDRQGFTLANGQRLMLEIGETAFRIDGRVRTSIVVFADDNAPALLGAYTMEAFSLAADPVNRRLMYVDSIL